MFLYRLQSILRPNPCKTSKAVAETSLHQPEQIRILERDEEVIFVLVNFAL